MSQFKLTYSLLKIPLLNIAPCSKEAVSMEMTYPKNIHCCFVGTLGEVGSDYYVVYGKVFNKTRDLPNYSMDQ